MKDNVHHFEYNATGPMTSYYTMEQKGCPDCERQHQPKGPDLSQCTLHKPLMIVIPPEGVHLSCPVHPAGHHLHGTQVRC